MIVSKHCISLAAFLKKLHHFSLLGMGYKLEQIVQAAEETKKIRKNREQSMKGSTWDRFKAVFEKTNKKLLAEPKIVAAKSG